MNKKQKICLWGGIGIINLVGGLTLYNKLEQGATRGWGPGSGPSVYRWSAGDILILLILIAITIAVLIFSLKDKKLKDKDEQKQ